MFRDVSPRIRRRLAAALLSVAVLGAACGSNDTETTEAAGESASGDSASDGAAAWPHDFTAELIGGGTIDAGDYEGQDLVLWFWAPW